MNPKKYRRRSGGILHIFLQNYKFFYKRATRCRKDKKLKVVGRVDENKKQRAKSKRAREQRARDQKSEIKNQERDHHKIVSKRCH